MAYIGRGLDKISNVEKLDNLTFDGSSTSFALQKGGSSFVPSSANNILLSIDGVVQAGNFTVSGSTIDFGVAPSGSSTCDFILHYGVGLITTPADGTVSLDKLSATGTKDATTFLRGDNTFATPISVTMTPAFHAYRSSGQSITTNTVTKIQLNLEIFDTDSAYDNVTNYRFTPQVAGKYFVYGNVSSSWTGSVGGYKNETFIYKNGSSTTGLTTATINDFYNTAGLDLITGIPTVGIVDFNGSTDYVELYHLSNANTPFVAGSFGAYKIIE